MAEHANPEDEAKDQRPAPTGEAGEHHWLRRHQHFYFTRTAAADGIARGLLLRASRQKRALMRADEADRLRRFGKVDAGPPPPAPFWTPLGPSVVGHGQAGGHPPVSGRITGLAVGPGGQRVYAGSANGGLWYSEDAGDSWTTLEAYDQPLSAAKTLGLEADSLSVGALAVRFGASAANDLIYVGTGEANFSADSYFGVGIKSSTSGGPSVTWTLEATNLAGLAISRIVIDPENPDVVYAATSGGLFIRPQGGAPVATWTPVSGSATSGLPNGRVTDLIVGGLPSKRLYYVALRGYAVYQSADAGTSPTGGTWVPVAGIPAGAPNSGRIALAPADSPPASTYSPVIYALLDNATLYRLDKPSTGPPAAGPPPPPPPDPATLFRPVSGIPRALFYGSQGTYDIVLGVDPSDPNTVYLAGDTVYSDDWSLSFYKGTITSGAAGYVFPFNPANDMIVNPDGTKDSSHVASDPTWIGQGVHADGHALAFPQNADGTHDTATVWVGTDGGLFRSTQIGQRGSFQPRNTGLAVTQLTFIAHRPDTDAVLFGGAQDQGNLRFRGEMVCFEAPEGDGGGVAFDPNKPDRVMRQYTNMDLYTSIDGGNSGTWTDLGDAGLFPPAGSNPNAAQKAAIATEKGNSPFYGPIAAIARDANTTLAAFGTNRLWVTDDWGNTWNTLPSLTNPYAAGAANLAQDVLADISPGIAAIAWASASLVFVATRTLVWRFTLAGAAWTPNPPAALPVTGLPPGRIVTALAVEDPARGTIYAVLGGGGYSHVWYFDPDPAINQWVDAGLTAATLDCPVHAVVVDPANSDHVYVGTDVGVFQGVKAGAAWTWTSFSNRLPECAVTCLSIHPRTRVLRAATHGLGVWEIALDAPTIDPDIYLRVNYADSGRLTGSSRPAWLDGAPDPTNPGATLTHTMSADIKTLRSSGSTLPGNTDFLGFASLKDFATDLGTIDSLGTNQVFVEVHNRGFTPIAGDQVRALLLLADATGGVLPALPAGFASHIQNGDIDPGWLGGSGWSFVDATNPFRTLPGTLSARTPQVVEFDLRLSSSSTSDICVAAFITTPADPLTATTTDVNALTMQDKHVALRSLHVGTDWRVVLGVILVVVAVAAAVIVAKEV
jgi:hypothetical protein